MKNKRYEIVRLNRRGKVEGKPITTTDDLRTAEYKVKRTQVWYNVPIRIRDTETGEIIPVKTVHRYEAVKITAQYIELR